jgi:hypothetical protein
VVVFALLVARGHSGVPIELETNTCGRSATAARRPCGSTGIARKPWKPWGCGSRRGDGPYWVLREPRRRVRACRRHVEDLRVPAASPRTNGSDVTAPTRATLTVGGSARGGPTGGTSRQMR